MASAAVARGAPRHSDLPARRQRKAAECVGAAIGIVRCVVQFYRRSKIGAHAWIVAILEADHHCRRTKERSQPARLAQRTHQGNALLEAVDSCGGRVVVEVKPRQLIEDTARPRASPRSAKNPSAASNAACPSAWSPWLWANWQRAGHTRAASAILSTASACASHARPSARWPRPYQKWRSAPASRTASCAWAAIHSAGQRGGFRDCGRACRAGR